MKEDKKLKFETITSNGHLYIGCTIGSIQECVGDLRDRVFLEGTTSAGTTFFVYFKLDKPSIAYEVYAAILDLCALGMPHLNEEILRNAMKK